LTFLLCSLALGITAATHVNAASNGKARASAHVFLFTGLIGIASGLDDVTAKIKNHGLAATMSSPGGWASLAGQAIEGYRSGRLRSIIVVGYSVGARSALEMATQLDAAKVPIKLVVVIDGASGPPIPPNVRKLVNFYVSGGYGGPIARPAHFRGSLQNNPIQDSSVGHFSIINATERQLLGYVLAAAG
jgi:dienelactone hydrolase